MRLYALALIVLLPVLVHAQRLAPVRTYPLELHPTVHPSPVLHAFHAQPLSLLARESMVLRRAIPDTLLPENPQPPVPSTKQPASTSTWPLSLRRSGSIRRGIIAGNRRSAAIDSRFQMQLSGKLAEDVEIEATLSDRNLPIQPEGTTRRLQELDQVFIHIRTPHVQARLGNFDVRMEDNALAPLRRKVQGVGVQASLTVPSLGEVSTEVVGAVSRGVFHVQRITLEDGVQGPYRLTGKYGEPFILILAGTERVYLDGELLVRGEDADYTIDYATAELYFTHRRPVTSEQRVRVEFEYITGRYTRSLLAGRSTWKRGTWFQGQVQFIREADSRSLLGGESYGIDVRELLAATTDEDVLVSSARVVPFDAEAPYVLYTRRDTVIEGRRISYFLPASSPADTVYRVTFTYVGSGKGSYQRSPVSSVGISYTWVGPGKGDYEPVIRIQPPQALQVASTSGVLQPLRWMRLSGAFAWASFNKNRLSTRPEAGVSDGAYTLKAEVKPDSLRLGSAYLSVQGHITRRYVGASYRSFDRLRSPDFARTWNLEHLPPEHLQREGLGEISQEWAARATWGTRARAYVRQQALEFRMEDIRTQALEGGLHIYPRRAWDIGYEVRNVRGADGTTRSVQEGFFISPLLYLRTTLERNIAKDANGRADSLWSYAFWQVAPRLQLEKKGVGLRVGGRFRQEKRLIDQNLQPAFALRVLTFQTYLNRKYIHLRIGFSTQQKRFTGTFQQLGYRNTAFTGLETSFRWTPAVGWLRITGRYEAGSERVAQLEEVFVWAGTEMGQYIWVDVNKDGIRQLDEFLPESTPYEGTYIKLLVPSQKLRPATRVRASIRLFLDGSRRKHVPAWLKKLRSTTLLSIQEQSTWHRTRDIFLLRQTHFRRRESTLRGTLHIQQTLRLHNLIPHVLLEPHLEHTASLQSLTYGVERRDLWNYALRMERPVTQNIKGGITLRQERVRSQNDTYLSKNYRILRHQLTTFIQIAPGLGSQIHGEIVYSRARLLDTETMLRIWKMPLRGLVRLSSRLQGSIQLTYSSIQGRIDAYDWRGYELTEGRGTGSAFSWNGTLTYRTGPHSRLELGYSGRKSRDLPFVQTLRASFSLLF